MKKGSGITLVALVITVIVLIILAGVAISAITGEDGIFSKAKILSEKYNNASVNEAEKVNELVDYLNKTKLVESYFDTSKKVNTPDTSKLSDLTTKYVTYTDAAPYQEILSSEVPSNWFDYNSSKWANIKTTSTDKSLEAYWVWIPRFAYKLPESSTAKTIEVAFVKGTSKTVVLSDGTEVQGYYSTDTAITTDGSGLYSKKTSDVASKWIIHPAFTFGDKQLNGIWVAKYEASSSNPSATNGGDNTTELKVQVKPGVTSWRNITAANSFANCRAIQNDGGVLGTATGTTTLDTHMIKNIEWGAVAILSQSKYGFYVSGANQQVWNNPDSNFTTGMAGTAPDLGYTSHENCYKYNTSEGTKASTTGNVYGIYDTAGVDWDIVAGILVNYSDILGTSIESKYYDIYTNAGDQYNDYAGGKIGDATKELLPSSFKTWNGDVAYFINSSNSVFSRGGDAWHEAEAGIFAFGYYNGGVHTAMAFRPTLVIV